MRKALALAVLFVSWLHGSSPASAQSLLLRYNFDNDAATDTGSLPAANGTVIPGATGAGFVSNTPSAIGRAYSTGNGGAGADAGYITTGTAGSPDAGGDVAKLDGLPALTYTAWINLQGNPGSASTPDRIMSDGGVNVGGFDFGLSGSNANAITLVAFARGATTGANSNTGGSTADASNKWLFVAVTYDGSQTTDNVRFYTGTPSAGVAPLGGFHTLNVGTLADNTASFQVGGTTESTSDRTPVGYFDDVRVYSGAADQAFLEGVRLQNIPEPTAVAPLAAAAAGLLARRRR